ncbi:hypothetical protein [Oryzifoliimicrobium ureilyticus]|uniref:hypothetical protein n=1 Tax=Oryzifoliimicrobium ureilyticus TaxID=3113724 RepID=UPI00307678DD
MKLKYIAAGAALLMSTPAFAVTPAYTTSTTDVTAAGKYQSISGLFAAAYDDWLSGWSSIVGNGYTLSQGAPKNGAVASFKNSFTSTLTYNNISDQFNYTTSFNKATGRYTSAASYNSPTAVPGPEAGAGIGALTLGGMALYLKRRRKEEAAAA